jgi:hypothetical protein
MDAQLVTKHLPRVVPILYVFQFPEHKDVHWLGIPHRSSVAGPRGTSFKRPQHGKEALKASLKGWPHRY